MLCESCSWVSMPAPTSRGLKVDPERGSLMWIGSFNARPDE